MIPPQGHPQLGTGRYRENGHQRSRSIRNLTRAPEVPVRDPRGGLHRQQLNQNR